MDARRQRAEEILATGKIDRQGHIFFVPSQSGKPRHSVMLDEPGPTSGPTHQNPPELLAAA
jgi:hypothetical protein